MRRPAPKPQHVALDLSTRRRVFACGDVHGHLGLLRARMAAVGYDGASGDVLVCTGDWLDRGGDALEIRDLLAGDPSILWTRGNHETMLHATIHETTPRARLAAQAFHVRHGGEWIFDHLVERDGEEVPTDEIAAFSERLNSAPVAYRILTPGGNDVGIVHADVPADTWADMAKALNGREPARSDMAHRCLWGRERANRMLADRGREQNLSVPDVDHVFIGHTIVGREPFVHGNVTMLDTGAYATGVLTLVDVDGWIAAQRR